MVGARLLRGRRRRTCGSPARWQERRQIEQPDSAREFRQHVGEVLDRIYAGEPTRAEDRVCDRRALATGVGPREEKILPSQGRSDVEPLDDAVVERQVAVVEEAAEGDLVVGEVLERLAEVRRRRLVLFADVTPLASSSKTGLLRSRRALSLASGSRSRSSSSIA